VLFVVLSVLSESYSKCAFCFSCILFISTSSHVDQTGRISSHMVSHLSVLLCGMERVPCLAIFHDVRTGETANTVLDHL